MKKRLAALVVGLTLLGSSGCATWVAARGIDHSRMTEGQKTVAGVAVLPFAFALDLALLPVEFVAALMILSR